MNEDDLRRLISAVRRGKLSRRRFNGILASLGVTAPLAGQLLTWSGLATAQAASEYKPLKRGGGGLLKLLWWQGPTTLNPHFAGGDKDADAARIFYEPLAAVSPDGQPVPILAAEVPSLKNGDVAADGRSVTWRLKRNVTWHDGKPFTADDVVFTWEYVSDPAAASVSLGYYREVRRAERIDAYTVRVHFHEATPLWARPFVGPFGMVLPKHQFDAFRGAKSRDAPANLRPVGTGPYRFVDFKPGDLVRGQLNPNYHEPNRPHFDAIEIKGGGDAVSAARAVLQTGEFDFAWNLQVEDEVLTRLEQGGKGRAMFTAGSEVEHIICNFSDPWTEVDGERSSAKTKHPILTDPAVRDALNLLVDRGSIQKFVYGRGGVATRNYLNKPDRFCSPNTKWEFNVDKATQALEAGGWKRGKDGVRAKDGRQLKLVFQTTINAPRQKSQQIIKAACQKAGIDLELKPVTASVFFSSDVANPDTVGKFYADLEMFAIGGQPDPWFLMNQFCSWEIASKENKWLGRNRSRWRNAEYDEVYRSLSTEFDPVKRAAKFIRLNELIIENRVAIPLVNRADVVGVANGLRVTLSAWDSNLWQLKDWYREG